MRVAIVSDIHSNRQALEAALEELSSRNVDRFWSTGDFINYGANPAFVMEWVLTNVEMAVLGNHDAVISEREGPDYFNRFAKETIPYTREQLESPHFEYLDNLKLMESAQNVRLVHAAPDHPENWEYIMSPGQARRVFSSFDEKICFFGHTHVQGVFDEDGNWMRDKVVHLEQEKRYLVNPGSLGQPRDRDSRWAAAIYDSEKQTIELIRGEYDIEGAAKEIKENGLPPFLGDRLFQGR